MQSHSCSICCVRCDSAFLTHTHVHLCDRLLFPQSMHGTIWSEFKWQCPPPPFHMVNFSGIACPQCRNCLSKGPQSCDRLHVTTFSAMQFLQKAWESFVPWNLSDKRQISTLVLTIIDLEVISFDLNRISFQMPLFRIRLWFYSRKLNVFTSELCKIPWHLPTGKYVQTLNCADHMYKH